MNFTLRRIRLILDNYIGKIPDLKEVLAEEGQQKRTSESRSNRRI